MKGKLVIISAPSGAGKTTIVKHLLSSGLNLEFSISATTREIREGEKNGTDYYFMSPDEFRRKVENEDFVEWVEVYKDHFYGTLKSELERIWAKGNHVLFDVDVKGGVSLKRIFSENAISLFIKPPSLEELEFRLVNRGTDKPEKIKIRLEKAREELSFEDHFDHVVINDNLMKARDEGYNLIKGFIQ